MDVVGNSIRGYISERLRREGPKSRMLKEPGMGGLPKMRTAEEAVEGNLRKYAQSKVEKAPRS